MVRRKNSGFALAGAVAVTLSVLVLGAPRQALAAGSPDPDISSYNGLALTPPMGWSDWYVDGCGVDASDMTSAASELGTTGLQALGYDFVNVDDCWMSDSNGLVPNATTFPGGISGLAATIHSDGLKLGIYQSAGTNTCSQEPAGGGQFPGLYPSNGNYASAYQKAANTFASWGVDFLKLDYCKVPSGVTPESLYQAMSTALVGDSPSRPIVYSQELPIQYATDVEASPPTDVAEYDDDIYESSTMSNMWRVASDETSSFQAAVIDHFEQDLSLSQYAHPGSWNDLDMLTIGNPTKEPGWTQAQQQAEMSIWSEMASPLIISTNLSSISAAALQVLSNKQVIDVDQDPLGIQGRLIAQYGPVDVVAKPMANGRVSVLFVNTSSSSPYTFTAGVPVATGESSYTVTDLWDSSGDSTNTSGTIDPGTLPADGTDMYEINSGASLCDGSAAWCIQDQNGTATSGNPVVMEAASPGNADQVANFVLDTGLCDHGLVDESTDCPWASDPAMDEHYNGDEIWQITFPDVGSQGPDYWCLAGAINTSGAPPGTDSTAVLGTCASTAQNNLWVQAPLNNADGSVGLVNVYYLNQVGGTNGQGLDALNNTAGTQAVVDNWTGAQTQQWNAEDLTLARFTGS